MAFAFYLSIECDVLYLFLFLCRLHVITSRGYDFSVMRLFLLFISKCSNFTMSIFIFYIFILIKLSKTNKKNLVIFFLFMIVLEICNCI